MNAGHRRYSTASEVKADERQTRRLKEEGTGSKAGRKESPLWKWGPQSGWNRLEELDEVGY